MIELPILKNKYEGEYMNAFKVWPGDELNPCIEKDPIARLTWLEESDPGEILKIEALRYTMLEMTEAEYDELPEYDANWN